RPSRPRPSPGGTRAGSRTRRPSSANNHRQSAGTAAPPPRGSPTALRSTRRSSRFLGQDFGDAINETSRGIDHLPRLGFADAGLRANSVVYDYFALVAAREKPGERSIHARIFFCQASKSRSHAAMRFGDLSRSLEDQRLGRMEGGEIRRACGFVSVMEGVEPIARFIQVIPCLC